MSVHVGEVEPVELAAGLDEVEVAVDERRGHQPALQVDDLVGAVVRRRAVVVAEPDDAVAVGGQRAHSRWPVRRR